MLCKHEGKEFKDVDYIFDSKFAAALARKQKKFYSAEQKAGYVFPKGLAEYVTMKENGGRNNCYYLPFNLGKKQWVGIVIDLQAGKLVVLDTNKALMTDKSVNLELKYMADMIPYLVQSRITDEENKDVESLIAERAKGISQNIKLNDMALRSILLMGIHALHGIEVCSGISGEVIAAEGRAAAVMAYGFHETLDG